MGNHKRWIGAVLVGGICGAALAQGDEDAAPADTFPVPRPSMMAPLAPKTALLDLVDTGSQLLAVGMYGHILRSTDGKTWQQVQSPISAMINRVRMLDGKTGWAVGHDVSILKTEDGGNTWKLQNYDGKIGRPLYDIHMADTRNGIAVGSYGMYYTTADGGATWAPREFPFTTLGQHLNALVELGDGSLFIAGERGLMAHSTDGGENWRLLKPPYTGSYFGALPYGERGVLLHGLRGSVYAVDDVARCPVTEPAEYENFEERKTLTDAATLAPMGFRHFTNVIHESLLGGFWKSKDVAVLVGVNGVVRAVDMSTGTVTAIRTPADEILSTALAWHGRLLAVGRRGVQDLGAIGEGN